MTNSIQSPNLPLVLAVGTGKSTVAAGTSNGISTAKSTSTVSNLNLLGLIHADTVTAIGQTRYASGKGAANTTGNRFVNLRIGMRSFTINVAPNTRVNLPGIGYVVLNERRVSQGQWGASVSEIMIHVYVNTNNSLGLPVGTEIKVAQANNSIQPH